MQPGNTCALRCAYNTAISDSAESVAREFSPAIIRQVMETLAGLMTPEHRFVDSPGSAVVGWEKIRAGWAELTR